MPRGPLGSLLWLLLFLLLLLTSACAQPWEQARGPVPSLALAHGSERHEFAGMFRILRDPDGLLTIDDVLGGQQAPDLHVIPGARVSLGFTKDVYWVNLAVDNPEPEQGVWFLELSRAMGHADLYGRDGAGRLSHERAGKMMPFSARQDRSGALTFRLSLGAHERRELWLRLASRGRFTIHPVVWAAGAFGAEVTRRDLTSAAYFGAITAMSLFNLFIWLSVRDRAYLYYALFQSTVMLTLGALDQSTYRFLWPESPEWAARSESFFGGPMMAAAAGFARAFLGPQYVPRWASRTMRGLMVLGLLMSAAAIITDHAILRQFALSMVVATCAVLLGASMIATAHGSPNGPIFIAAWLTLLLSGVLAALTSFGFLGSEALIIEVPKVGSSVEAVLLSFGLAQRIQRANRDKEEAQHKLVQQERAQAKILERKVAERTRDLQKALEDLRETQDRMVKQARLASLGHLVAGVAHEIGNPLNFVVGGSTELARRLQTLQRAVAQGKTALESSERMERLLGEAQRSVALVQSGSERIHHIIEQLRAHTRARPIAEESVDPIMTLEATLALLEGMIERQKIQVVRDFESVPPIISWRGGLGQVFLNLLLNSCQAMPDGGTITVRVRTAGSNVEMIFSDTGPGISEEHREAIFDPFFTTRLSEGTGLGLSLSLRTIEDHGGELRLLESDRGAVFMVMLPCVRENHRGLVDGAIVEDRSSKLDESRR